MRTLSSLTVTALLLFGAVGFVLLPAASAAAPPAEPSPQSVPTPTASSDIPIVLKLNSDSLKQSTAFPDPYYLGFEQITGQIPGGWAAIQQGGPDAATIFHYPGAPNKFQHISSTYNPALPTLLSLAVNSGNETGKIFNFQVDIDLDNDNATDVFIAYPTFTTTKQLQNDSIDLAATSITFTDPLKTAMVDARIFLRVWRSDTVPENPYTVARLYTGYIYQSTITLPWINPAPTAHMDKPDLTETYWTSLPITFSAYGSTDPYYNLSNLNARWDFGPNISSSFGGGDANVTKIFRTPGFYNITLTISNTLGFFDIVKRQIQVVYKNVPPTVSATLVEGINVHINSFSGFQGVPYNFSAVYDDVDNGRENVSITWDFGDGGVNFTGNATHTFNGTGDFDVKASAFDKNDTTFSHIAVNISKNRLPVITYSGPSRVNKGSPVTFSAIGTNDPDGFPIKSYRWNFGDPFCTENNSCEASSVVATHRYDVGGNYIVTLQAFDGIETSTYVASIRVNQQPLAVCPAPKSVETSRNVSFDGLLSRDPDNDLLLFRWKFGDGFDTEYSFNATTTHVYTVPKPEGYSAQLIVNDSLWTHSCTFLVRVDLVNEPPLAKIWCAVEVIWLGDVLRCSANQSTDEFELTFLWDFDASDGVSLSDDFRKEVQILYRDPGQYTISLEVKDNKGKISDTSINVVVKENPGYCNQVFDMSSFLRQTSASPPDQDRGSFTTGKEVGAGNITAAKKGCFVAYSIDMKPGDKIFADITIKDTLEGKVTDILMFDTPNFIIYQDKNPATLPPVITDCFSVGQRGTYHCEYTATRSGTLYIVIDNKDRPLGLTASDGPVEYQVKTTMPWKLSGPVDPKLVPFLVGGALAAVALVVLIFWLSRRQEASY